MARGEFDATIFIVLEVAIQHLKMAKSLMPPEEESRVASQPMVLARLAGPLLDMQRELFVRVLQVTWENSLQ